MPRRRKVRQETVEDELPLDKQMEKVVDSAKRSPPLQLLTTSGKTIQLPDPKITAPASNGDTGKLRSVSFASHAQSTHWQFQVSLICSDPSEKCRASCRW